LCKRVHLRAQICEERKDRGLPFEPLSPFSPLSQHQSAQAKSRLRRHCVLYRYDHDLASWRCSTLNAQRSSSPTISGVRARKISRLKMDNVWSRSSTSFTCSQCCGGWRT
jgi:hypothetical protein